MDTNNIDEATNAQNCIKFNNFQGSAKLCDGESFNKEYLNYLCDIWTNENYITNELNHGQVINALNVLYLDVDYNVDKSIIQNGNIENEEFEIATIYVETFLEKIDCEHHVYIFIPVKLIEENGRFKCGAHVFVYLNKNITKKERADVYNYTRDMLMFRNNDKLLSLLHFKTLTKEEYNKTFDIQPIITANTLLLFAEKINAKRHYKLVNVDDFVNDMFENEKIFNIIPTSNVQNVKFEEETTDNMEIVDINGDIDKPYTDGYEYIKSEVVKEGLKFLESLIILSQKHKYWEVLGSHNERLNMIIKPCLYWFYYNEFCSNPWNLAKAQQYIPVIMSNILRKHMNVICLDEHDKKRINNCLRDIESLRNTLFSSEPYKFITKEKYAKYYDHVKNERNTIRRINAIKRFVEIIEPEIKIRVKNETDKEERKAIIKLHALKIESRLKAIKTLFVNVFSYWSNFGKFIMEYLSDEILPFETIPEDIKINNKDMLIYKHKLFLDESFMLKNNEYYETLKTLLKQFICIMFINLKKTADAIVYAIAALTRKYITTAKWGDKILTLLYNIRQIKILHSYPYNQYIVDNDSYLSTDWIAFLYITLIDEELHTDHRIKFINTFLDVVDNNSDELKNVQKNTRLTPLSNLSSEIKRVLGDILLKNRANVNRIEPKYIDIVNNCQYLPMLNGVVEFCLTDDKKRNLKRGDVRFHKNNFDKYFLGGTIIPYNKNYNKENDEYKLISTLIEQTFPTIEKRKYVLSLYAQLLHSIGSRDQFIICYGKGGDGKSIFNLLISTMLGMGSKKTIETSNYKTNILTLVNGLADTVPVEALTQSKRDANGSDTNGLIKFENRRFITVQEPDTKGCGNTINMSTMKRITSGEPLSGRNLYETAHDFKVNAIVSIQTNDVLRMSDNSNATKRRLINIEYESKFLPFNEYEELTKRGDLKNIYVANKMLPSLIQENPYIWQATFEILKPYASEFIRNKTKGLSDIVSPLSVMKSNKLVLSSGTATSAFITSIMKKTDEKDDCVDIVSVKLLIETIINVAYDKNNSKSEVGIIEKYIMSKPKFEIEAYICKNLSDIYCTNKEIYIIKNKDETLIESLNNKITKQYLTDNFNIKEPVSALETVLLDDLDHSETLNYCFVVGYYCKDI